MKAYLDPLFTTEAASYVLTSTTVYYASTSHAWFEDFAGDNTYYWRIQPRYGPGAVNGVWSQGWRFEREGFVPQNLQTSVTFATPTFSWDMVEGAEFYDLQVSSDPSFNSAPININTRQNSYTDINTLPNALYYWRVRIRRFDGVINDWTIPDPLCAQPGVHVGCLDLKLPLPEGLTPPSGTIVNRAPTFCWTPLIKIPLLPQLTRSWPHGNTMSR